MRTFRLFHFPLPRLFPCPLTTRRSRTTWFVSLASPSSRPPSASCSSSAPKARCTTWSTGDRSVELVSSDLAPCTVRGLVAQRGPQIIALFSPPSQPPSPRSTPLPNPLLFAPAYHGVHEQQTSGGECKRAGARVGASPLSSRPLSAPPLRCSPPPPPPAHPLVAPRVPPASPPRRRPLPPPPKTKL